MTDNIQALKDERTSTVEAVQQIHRKMNEFDKWLNNQVMILGPTYERILVEFSYGANLESSFGCNEGQCYTQFEEGKRAGKIEARIRNIDGRYIELTEDLLDKITEKKLELYREAKRIELPLRRALHLARQAADNARHTWREAEMYANVEEMQAGIECGDRISF